MLYLKYMILFKLAKDVFIILITMVASKSIFRIGECVQGDYESSLSLKSLDVLLCSGN